MEVKPGSTNLQYEEEKKKKKEEREEIKTIRLYGALDNFATCKICHKKKYQFIVYQCCCCSPNVNSRFYCIDCCASRDLHQYSCMKCTGARYIIEISKWYKKILVLLVLLMEK